MNQECEKKESPQVLVFWEDFLSSIVSSITLSKLMAMQIHQRGFSSFQKKKKKKQTSKMKFSYPTAVPREFFTLQATNSYGLLLLIVLCI